MKTGTSCARCANAATCPAYDARMLYGFCQGFADSDDYMKDVAILDDDEPLVEYLGVNEGAGMRREVFQK